MKYVLEKYNDMCDRWDYIFSSDDYYVIETAYYEHLKYFKKKKKHLRIV